MSVNQEGVLFEEEQSFGQPWVWGLMLGTISLLGIIFGLVVFAPRDKDGFHPAIVGISLGIIVAVSVGILMYTLKLSVRLDSEALHVRFFPLIKKDIPLEEIVRWEARTYRPILEYGGWGVRCSGNGMAYNVSGNRGVQLEFTNGKRLLIGSQKPEELAEAISRAKQRAV